MICVTACLYEVGKLVYNKLLYHGTKRQGATLKFGALNTETRTNVPLAASPSNGSTTDTSKQKKLRLRTRRTPIKNRKGLLSVLTGGSSVLTQEKLTGRRHPLRQPAGIFLAPSRLGYASHSFTGVAPLPSEPTLHQQKTESIVYQPSLAPGRTTDKAERAA